ncbi:MAG: YciI family protein [Cytophagaceae bacterium]|nr:YciI family protein [Gemmatimonadaceae bacterium]
MQFMLLNYVKEAEFPSIPPDEVERWFGAYRAYVDAMAQAGVLVSQNALKPTTTATSVRVIDGKTQVLDGPYAESREQLGGYHLIEVPDLDAAIAWAARCPTALHGTVEVRPVRDPL